MYDWFKHMPDSRGCDEEKPLHKPGFDGKSGKKGLNLFLWIFGFVLAMGALAGVVKFWF